MNKSLQAGMYIALVSIGFGVVLYLLPEHKNTELWTYDQAQTRISLAESSPAKNVMPAAQQMKVAIDTQSTCHSDPAATSQPC